MGVISYLSIPSTLAVNGTNDFHCADEELEPIWGMNLSKEAESGFEPRPPKTQRFPAPRPRYSPTLAARQDDTGTTHFPPGCVTVDWIFASVPVFLRDT